MSIVINRRFYFRFVDLNDEFMTAYETDNSSLIGSMGGTVVLNNKHYLALDVKYEEPTDQLLIMYTIKVIPI